MEGFVEIEGFPNYFIAHTPPRVVRVTEDGIRECTQTRNSKKDNYWTVTIRNKEGKYKKLGVHRLLMLAFVPNPHNKPQVNHIDGDKSNNDMDNLEWATARENSRHAIKLGLTDPRRSIKEVHRYSLSGEYIDSFESVVDAAKTHNIEATNIANSARGTRMSAGGFRWSYIKKDHLKPLSKGYVDYYIYNGVKYHTIRDLAKFLGKNNPDKYGLSNINKEVREAITIVYKS